MKDHQLWMAQASLYGHRLRHPELVDDCGTCWVQERAETILSDIVDCGGVDPDVVCASPEEEGSWKF